MGKSESATTMEETRRVLREKMTTDELILFRKDMVAAQRERRREVSLMRGATDPETLAWLEFRVTLATRLIGMTDNVLEERQKTAQN